MPSTECSRLPMPRRRGEHQVPHAALDGLTEPTRRELLRFDEDLVHIWNLGRGLL